MTAEPVSVARATESSPSHPSTFFQSNLQRITTGGAWLDRSTLLLPEARHGVERVQHRPSADSVRAESREASGQAREPLFKPSSLHWCKTHDIKPQWLTETIYQNSGRLSHPSSGRTRQGKCGSCYWAGRRCGNVSLNYSKLIVNTSLQEWAIMSIN